jgi:hypothetical protein
MDKLYLALKKIEEAESILETLENDDDKNFVLHDGNVQSENLRSCISYYEIKNMIGE